MQSNTIIEKLYLEIRKSIFNMIPEKCDEVYLYATVIVNEEDEESGEMFFFYYPKGIIRKRPINVYEIPSRFNIEEKSYMILARKLYELLKQLRKQCKIYYNINWSNVTISIKNIEFKAEYNCDDLVNSFYSEEDRKLIWQYKYLNYPIEKISKPDQEILDNYLAEAENGMHKIFSHIENFYKKTEKRTIIYNNLEEAEANSIKKEKKIKNQILKL